ncbi:hypothetical protein LEP1GSC166_3413 [Leptospira kirschneri]|nr:hypothetical protein LEP1GSC198_3108 [Leptospira kirschneri str. JB]EMK10724.1 hypothetical protein LEP1GSC166_3413 [Leptospira kirschneri]
MVRSNSINGSVETQAVSLLLALEVAQQNGSLWIAFEIESKDDCCITFLLCNLLTGAERGTAKPDSPLFSSSNSY